MIYNNNQILEHLYKRYGQHIENEEFILAELDLEQIIRLESRLGIIN